MMIINLFCEGKSICRYKSEDVPELNSKVKIIKSKEVYRIFSICKVFHMEKNEQVLDVYSVRV